MRFWGGLAGLFQVVFFTCGSDVDGSIVDVAFGDVGAFAGAGSGEGREEAAALGAEGFADEDGDGVLASSFDKRLVFVAEFEEPADFKGDVVG